MRPSKAISEFAGTGSPVRGGVMTSTASPRIPPAASISFLPWKQPCPVAVIVGMHPAMFMLAGLEIPYPLIQSRRSLLGMVGLHYPDDTAIGFFPIRL